MDLRPERGLALAFVVLIVMLVVVVVAGSTAVYMGRMVDGIKPIPPDACPCNTDEDRKDMQNRLAEAQAAVDKANSDLASNPSSSKPTSESQKESDSSQISEAMGAKEVNKVAGTKPTCETWTSKDKPACIRWALQTHENVHSAACQKFLKGGGKGDWNKAGTRADYWREDASAYQAEVDFLKSKLPACGVDNYPGAQSREEQLARRAGSKRRATTYAAGLRT